MELLLKLKNWQLFGITWGIPIILNFLTVSDSQVSSLIFPVQMLFFSIGTFGWIWAISTSLQELIPKEQKLNIIRFKIIFLIPLIYVGLTMLGSSTTLFHSLAGEGGNLSWFEVSLIIVHLTSMVCVFYGVRFAAKTIKTLELGREVSFNDYSSEFFLIWISFIGQWSLQSRLNKLIHKV